jgi:hypothetical protein
VLLRHVARLTPDPPTRLDHAVVHVGYRLDCIERHLDGALHPERAALVVLDNREPALVFDPVAINQDPVAPASAREPSLGQREAPVWCVAGDAVPQPGASR